MSCRSLPFFLLLLIAVAVRADDKGYCPAKNPPAWTAQTKPEAKTKPPFADAEYLGQVRARIVISDKGYVCIAEIIQSLNEQADEKALAALRGWKFKPAEQGDRTVPAIATVSFFYWRDSNGRVTATHTITPLSSLP